MRGRYLFETFWRTSNHTDLYFVNFIFSFKFIPHHILCIIRASEKFKALIELVGYGSRN